MTRPNPPAPGPDDLGSFTSGSVPEPAVLVEDAAFMFRKDTSGDEHGLARNAGENCRFYSSRRPSVRSYVEPRSARRACTVPRDALRREG